MHVWCGVVWWGAVWCGVVRFDLASKTRRDERRYAARLRCSCVKNAIFSAVILWRCFLSADLKFEEGFGWTARRSVDRLDCTDWWVDGSAGRSVVGQWLPQGGPIGVKNGYR